MSGLQLSSMELSDMLDVIHVIFEEDLTSATSAEQIDARIVVRKIIYEQIYEREYKYDLSSTLSGTDASTYPMEDEDETVLPFSPSQKTVQPYTPPTEFDADSSRPFGSVLDEPLN